MIKNTDVREKAPGGRRDLASGRVGGLFWMVCRSNPTQGSEG